ncbi:MAG TPA: phosphoribosyltransferase family protein [Ohtaekwangia sp.]
MNSRVAEIFNDFVSLFFPKYCLACYGSLMKGEDLVCSFCKLEMPQTNYHLEKENSLKTRLDTRMSIKYGMALFNFSKQGKVQHLLHALKYKNFPEVGIMLGKLYGEKLLCSGYSSEFDCIVPVPLHPARQRKRGYNQSTKIAQGLSEKLLIPVYDNALKREIMTDTQTKKSKLSRWINVKEIFSLTPQNQLKNKRVLLVDDVVTTGSTLEACVEAILKSDCLDISILCLAEVK